jgi:hypothetical protein
MNNPNSKKTPQTRAANILSGGIGNYPIRLELVPKRLVVSITQIELLGRGSHIPCWIFVTEGMLAFKQKEFVLALRIDNAEERKKFPKAPIQLFMHLFKSVAQKKRFHIGDVTPLGEKGLMGYMGIGYTHELINGEGLKLPKASLTCMLLTKEELLAARTVGLTRVLARMGYEQNRFPANAWNETTRTGTAMQAVMQGTEFKKIKCLPLSHCSINLINGDKVSLILSPVIHAIAVGYLKLHGANNKIGFTTQLLPYHEGALVWLPVKDVVEMNLHPDSNGELIAGSFLILSRGDQAGASMLEDGFMVNLDNDAWIAFQNAIVRKQNINIAPTGNDMAFEVVWNTAANTDAVSGLGAAAGGLGGNAGDIHDGERSLMGKIKGIFKR